MFPDCHQVRNTSHVGVRFKESDEVLLDCQIAINTPVRKRSTVRGAHVDQPDEIYAGLLYFRYEYVTGNYAEMITSRSSDTYDFTVKSVNGTETTIEALMLSIDESYTITLVDFDNLTTGDVIIANIQYSVDNDDP
jgi:hypothetical protein